MRFIPFIIACSLVVVHTDTAFAERICRTVNFKNGYLSAVVSGTANSNMENTDCFVFATESGQTATVKLLNAANNDVAFNIGSIAENQDTATFKTQKTNYRIDVYRTFARSPQISFKLSISVK